MPDLWIDTDRPTIDRINGEMRAASDAFDLAHHQSPSWAELDTHVAETIRALRRVQRIVRNQQVGGRPGSGGVDGGRRR